MKGLSKRFFAREVLQRMPYTPSSIYEVCLACVDKVCLPACEEEILKLNPDGVPTLDFSIGGCVFCEKCAKSCLEVHSKGVGFDLEYQKVNVTMQINALECLAWNHSICQTCKDVCPCKIEFVGMFYPEIVDCIGCGMCISRCPTNAIEIKNLAIESNNQNKKD